MLQILSNFWKVQSSKFPVNFVIWPHVVEGWEGLDAGLLLLVAVMGAVVDVTIWVMVEGVDGDFLAHLIEVTMIHVTGTLAISSDVCFVYFLAGAWIS